MKRKKSANNKLGAPRTQFDRPIQKIEEDLLGRAAFAEQLAQAILQWKSDDSLTLALYGPWGSGKTSLKNLVVKNVKDASEEKEDSELEVIEFNAWQFSNQQQLFFSFLQELEKGLLRTVTSESDKEQIRKDFSSYALLIGCITPFVLMATCGSTEPALTNGIAANLAVNLIKGFLDSGKSIMEHLSKKTESADLSIDTLKAKISKTLKKSDKTLLVVIDDIDRLHSPEIKLIMQLVKVNCDFPHVVYLLCFQRDIIENALNDDAHTGKDFLEKIIQIGFNLPQIDVENLYDFYGDKIKELAIHHQLSKDLNSIRWSKNIQILRENFSNLRQVKRFLNSFEFYLGLLKRGDNLEVDLLDLIAIETMRNLFPKIHEKLFDIKHFLFSPALSQYYRHSDLEKGEELKDELISLLKLENEEKCIEILVILFPFLAWIFQKPDHEKIDNELWLKDNRICHEITFDRYFLLSIPRLDISQQEFDDLIDSINSSEDISELLDFFQKTDRLSTVLNRLDVERKRIKPDYLGLYIASLMDLSKFPSISPDDLLVIIERILKPLEESVRFRALTQAIKKTDGIVALSRLARSIFIDLRDQKKHPLCSPEASVKIFKQFDRKFSKLAKELDFKNLPDVAIVLYWWSQCSALGHAKSWMKTNTQADKDLLLILRSAIGRVTNVVNEVDGVGRIFPSDFNWLHAWFNDFFVVSEVKQRLVQISSKKNQSEADVKLVKAAQIIVSSFLEHTDPESNLEVEFGYSD